MKISAQNICISMLAIAAILMLPPMISVAQSQTTDSADTEKQSADAVPELAEIVPLATQLTSRLAALENSLKGEIKISEVEKSLDRIEASLEAPAARLQQMKESKGYKYNALVELRETIKQANRLFEKTGTPIGEDIRRLQGWQDEWLTEKKRWSAWQTSLREEGNFEQIEATFEKVQGTIGRALELIPPQLVGVLAVQEKSASIQTELAALDAELVALIEEQRRDALLSASPSMFSSQYISQFSSGELWFTVQKGLDEAAYSGARFFARHGWLAVYQVLFTLFAIAAVYRNRQALRPSKRWGFLAARPFAAGLFLGFMATDLIYEYIAAPGIWKTASTVIGGLSFARLSGVLVAATWKRQLVYGLITALIITRFMDVLSFPLPIFRLYTVLTALIGLVFFLRWATESGRRAAPPLYQWSLRLGALLFTIIVVAELWGKNALASYLFVSLISSLAVALVFMLFTYLIRGGVEWLFRISPLRNARALTSKDAEVIINRIARFVDILIWGLIFIPGLLMIWGVYENLEEATTGLLAFGFQMGAHRISIGLLMVAAGIVYGSFLASWVLQKLLMEGVLARRGVEKGARLSIGRLVHYAVLFVGFLYALATLGLEVTKLTIMLSALGVGIGFGLQGVVNNFISGLLLLFERPIRVGDTIEFDGKWAEIKRIGLRATTVKTFDEADVIIPNGNLIANEVTNWTLSNRMIRLIIPVGVAYGSDVALAMETLASCAKGQQWVAATRPPEVFFLSFGESSLDFQLRVWITDADHRLKASSRIHQEIDRRFREANIEIAFPQRDLHLRSVDTPIGLPPSEEAVS